MIECRSGVKFEALSCIRFDLLVVDADVNTSIQIVYHSLEFLVRVCPYRCLCTLMNTMFLLRARYVFVFKFILLNPTLFFRLLGENWVSQSYA